MPASIAQSVESANVASATTIAATLASAAVVGNALWVCVRAPVSVVITVGDNLGNVYTERNSVTEAGTGQHLRHFTAPVTSGGSCTITATYASAQANRGVLAVEVAGLRSGASVFDGSTAVTDTGSNPTPTMTVTNTFQPAIALALCNDVQGGTPAVGSGYTNGGVVWSTVSIARWQYRAISNVGAQTANFGNAGLDRNNAVMVVFLEPAPVFTPYVVYDANGNVVYDAGSNVVSHDRAA